jgi:hypothetical protein
MFQVCGKCVQDVFLFLVFSTSPLGLLSKGPVLYRGRRGSGSSNAGQMHSWMTAEIFRRSPAGDFVEKQE